MGYIAYQCLPPCIHAGVFIFAMCTILKKEVDNGHPREECNGPKLELVSEDYQQCGFDARPNRVKLEPGLVDEMVFFNLLKKHFPPFISSINHSIRQKLLLSRNMKKSV